MTTTHPESTPKWRDPRIDVFRGIALLIIFSAHLPGNTWDPFLPTRFGFSDAADVFVFCSGLACGIAYGRSYERGGFWVGSARVAVRCWQVYWAHISIFIAVASMMVAADWFFARGDTNIGNLNLKFFFNGDTAGNLLGLVTLTYVPNLFDILPLYVVLLAMIPLMMLVAKISPLAPLALSVGVWLVATQGYLQFPAEPWSDRPWQFHPLAWQLLFFGGYAFSRGWLRPPAVDTRLLIAAVVVLVVMAPIAFWPFARTVDVLKDAALAVSPWADKPLYGILRIVHFSCAAYVVFCLAGVGGRNLKGLIVDVAATVGRHSLGVFLVGIALSRVGGIALFELGHPAYAIGLVNVAGWGALVASAYGIDWIKSKPWARRSTLR